MTLPDQMKTSARYAKMITWSEEDGCYIGSCPELMHWCQIVEEVIALSPAMSEQALINRLYNVA